MSDALTQSVMLTGDRESERKFRINGATVLWIPHDGRS